MKYWYVVRREQNTAHCYVAAPDKEEALDIAEHEDDFCPDPEPDYDPEYDVYEVPKEHLKYERVLGYYDDEDDEDDDDDGDDEDDDDGDDEDEDYEIDDEYDSNDFEDFGMFDDEDEEDDE